MLKGATTTGHVTLICQPSVQGAPPQGAGLHAGRSGGALKAGMRSHAAAGRCRPARPPGGPRHLPAVGRDRGRGRRGPEGVVHGAAAASQVRPSVGGRGGGCWIREAGHCGARGESEAQAFRCTPATAGALPFRPCSLLHSPPPPNFQESKWAAKRGWGVAWGGGAQV